MWGISFYLSYIFLLEMYLTLGVLVNKYYNYWVKQHGYLVLGCALYCLILFTIPRVGGEVLAPAMTRIIILAFL